MGLCLSMGKTEMQGFGGEITMGITSNLRGFAPHLRCQPSHPLSSSEHICTRTVKTHSMSEQAWAFHMSAWETERHLPIPSL